MNFPYSTAGNKYLCCKPISSSMFCYSNCWVMSPHTEPPNGLRAGAHYTNQHPTVCILERSLYPDQMISDGCQIITCHQPGEVLSLEVPLWFGPTSNLDQATVLTQEPSFNWQPTLAFWAAMLDACTMAKSCLTTTHSHWSPSITEG